MRKSYFIEIAETVFDLETQVQKSIHNGYIPQGGPFLWIPHICQAMVLEEKQYTDLEYEDQTDYIEPQS